VEYRVLFNAIAPLCLPLRSRPPDDRFVPQQQFVQPADDERHVRPDEKVIRYAAHSVME